MTVETFPFELQREWIVRDAAREGRPFPMPATVAEDLARQRGHYLLRLHAKVAELMEERES